MFNCGATLQIFITETATEIPGKKMLNIPWVWKDSTPTSAFKMPVDIKQKSSNTVMN